MFRTKNIFLLASFLTPVVGFFVLSVVAQTTTSASSAKPAESHSVWEGTYTDNQAKRGEDLYHGECSSCHGDKLTGKSSENAPALSGQKFLDEWDGRTVGDLFRKILRKMPDDDPGTLSPQQTADLVAFILQFNKFPTGKAELPAENEPLSLIHFDKKPAQK